MRVNEHTSILTPRVTLVPYEVRHVAKYHDWMSDADIQAATASEPLTLEEEYENQASWRTSHDKLTFIICQPEPGAAEVTAGNADADDRMVGDVNFFLYPFDGDDEDDPSGRAEYVGEIDVMVAEKGDRGKGVGFGAVTALMEYVYRNLGPILEEYTKGGGSAVDGKPVLRGLMAKIKADNEKSVTLFKRVGFSQKGGVNYFGEMEMVLDDFVSLMDSSNEEARSSKLPWREDEAATYREVKYARPTE